MKIISFFILIFLISSSQAAEVQDPIKSDREENTNSSEFLLVPSGVYGYPVELQNETEWYVIVGNVTYKLFKTLSEAK